MNFSHITSRHADRKAVISLNRPDRRNALDDVMVTDLTAAFQAAARDADVKVVILRGEGPAFCAGADLEYLQKISRNDLEANRATLTAADLPIRPKPRRRKGSRPRVQFAVVEDHRCPFCLDSVSRADPRGVVECEVCHALHHKDCWDITGVCQVPHLNT